MTTSFWLTAGISTEHDQLWRGARSRTMSATIIGCGTQSESPQVMCLTKSSLAFSPVTGILMLSGARGSNINLHDATVMGLRHRP